MFIIAAGIIFGVLGALMVNWGNPANMGVCLACFMRDIAGALGLHRAGVVQYLRPEIMGILLGAFVASIGFREFKPSGGSSPLVRFILGAFFMVAALVFLGCTTRAWLRLAGGDLNAITGIAGLIVGIMVGIFFLRRGFNLGKAGRLPSVAGWIMPVLMVGLLLLAIFTPGFVFSSETGPGSMFAPLAVSVVVGLVIGFLSQRTRMCFAGGIRDLLITRDTYLFSGVAAFFVAALVTNYIAGNFGADGIYHWGFDNQPIAHNDHLWNFVSMTLAGLTVTMLGGCPLRQIVLAGEGSTDAGITILGMLVGAAFAHNFALASGPAGTGTWGPVAVIVGLVFCILVGFGIREKA